MRVIVNVTNNWGIGYRGRLLVSIPADLRNFRELTTGKTVVYGRKTLQTFPNGKPLPNRENIVLSAMPHLQVEGATVVKDLKSLLALKKNTDDICVIGGEQIYRLLLPYCDTAIVTQTDLTMAADRFFPNLDMLPEWSMTEVGQWQTWEGLRYRFVTYRKAAK